MFYFSWLILAHSNRTQLLTLGLVSQSRYMWNDAVWCGSLFQITLTVKLLFSFSIMLNLIKHLMVVITKVLGIYELKNLASQFALQFYISVHQQFFFFATSMITHTCTDNQKVIWKTVFSHHSLVLSIQAACVMFLPL